MVERALGSSQKALTPPLTSQRPSPNVITLRLALQHRNLVGGTIQSIAKANISTLHSSKQITVVLLELSLFFFFALSYLRFL